MVLALSLGVAVVSACAVDEEAALKRALETYAEVLDSLADARPLWASVVDSVAAGYDARVRVTAVRLRNHPLQAVARYRAAPTLVCSLRLANPQAEFLSSAEREPPVCETGVEPILRVALREYMAAQELYATAHQEEVDRSGPPATSVAELDLAPPRGVTTTILTARYGGHSAIATHDTDPDLVCGIRAGSPHPLQTEDARDVACGRDTRLAAQAMGRAPPRDTIAEIRRDVLAVGGTHACAIRAVGVVCWGDDRFGQLGDGVALGRTRSSLVVADGSLRSLAAGYAHTCGLDEEGRAYCWGANARGELGDGTFVDRAAPVAVVGGRRFVAIAAGPGISCGLTPDGTAYCWGLGAQTPQAISSPVAFRSFASSFCTLSVDDVPHCWFRLWSSEPGWDVAKPARTTARFRQVREGYGLPDPEDEWPFVDPSVALLNGERGCGVTRDDRVLCWNVRSSVFTVERSDSIFAAAVRVPSVQTVVAGANHACGLAAEGAVYCWRATGVNAGRDGAGLELTAPVVVGTSLRFRAIAAYGNRTCGIAEPDGDLFCWTGATTTPTRVAVAANDRVRKLAADLPGTEPRDTSDHWGFTLPRGLPIRFEGRVACSREAARVAEGPVDGRAIDIVFGSALPSIDELGNDLDDGEGLILGGFRWRIAVGHPFIPTSRFAEEPNDPAPHPPVARGRVFRDRPGCALTMWYEGDMRGDAPDVLIDALRVLRFPTDIDSGSVAANERGTMRYRAGQHAEALAEFRRAVALDDQNTEAVNNVGFVLFRLGRLEESVTWYRRAIELDPGRAVAYLNLGDSLEELGYHAEAVQSYERYLGLEPSGAAADRVRNVIGTP